MFSNAEWSAAREHEDKYSPALCIHQLKPYCVYSLLFDRTHLEKWNEVLLGTQLLHPSLCLVLYQLGPFLCDCLHTVFSISYM